jgi:hypothetical protein
MSRRIFVIDDDEVAREVALMLKQKENQRRGRYSSLMYDGGGNVIPYHVCEEHSSGCGVSHSVCGWEQPSYGCGGRRVSSYGCGGGGCGSYPTYGTCG